MRSDTILIKLLGAFGAIFVFLSLFMNVVTLDVHMGYTAEALIESGLDPENDNVDAYVRYGLTAWEFGTLAKNITQSITWDTGDREAGLEAVASLDKAEFEEMYALIGYDIDGKTLDRLFALLKYAVSSYSLFKLLPWAITVVCVISLVATVTSKRLIKLIMSVMMVACMIIMILPSKEFFSIMGVGPVIMMIGIALSAISAIGSFASPGVIYVSENK